jgi:hypothetical protein
MTAHSTIYFTHRTFWLMHLGLIAVCLISCLQLNAQQQKSPVNFYQYCVAASDSAELATEVLPKAKRRVALYKARVATVVKYMQLEASQEYAYPFRNSTYICGTTEKMLLQLNYGIAFKDIGFGYNEIPENVIYDSLMHQKIIKRWGKDIFERVHKLAYQLDNSGHGYVCAKPIDYEHFDRFLQQRLSYITEDSVRCDETSTVVFSIDDKGYVQDVEFYDYGWHGTHYPAKCAALVALKERILADARSVQWSPAYFKGIPRSCRYVVARVVLHSWLEL